MSVPCRYHVGTMSVSRWYISRRNKWCSFATVLSAAWYAVASAKLFAFHGLEESIYSLKLFGPFWTASLLSVLLIGAEFALGFGLLFPRTRRISAEGSLVLCCLFLGLTFYRVSGNIAAPCSCLGAVYHLSAMQTVCLDAFFASLAALALRALPKTTTLEVSESVFTLPDTN